MTSDGTRLEDPAMTPSLTWQIVTSLPLSFERAPLSILNNNDSENFPGLKSL